MAVFTVFCHGTNEHRANGHHTELVHALSEKAAGAEYQDYLILDGPGCGDQTNRMAGTFDPFDKSKGAKGSAPSWSKTDDKIMDVSSWSGSNAPTWNPSGTGTTVKGIGGAFTGGKGGIATGVVGTVLSPIIVPTGVAVLKWNSKARGLVYGTGMDDNIRHAMAAMGNLWADFNGQTVNMVGWSRGAVTCIRMANWIQEFYGTGVNVNIFAVDPVAGNTLGADIADTYVVPDVVKNFVAVIVMNDRRGGFRPQDINRLQVQKRDVTRFALLPMPGAHDTPVKMKSPDFAEVSEITRYLAYKFLLLSSTTFRQPEIQYSAIQLSERYAKIKLKDQGYAKLGKKGVGKAVQGGIITRDIARELDRYVSHNTSFFVNEHHVESFKLAFPRVYQIFFSSSPGIPGSRGMSSSYSAAAGSEIGQALQNMYQSSPSSFELLSGLGVVERRTTGIMGTGPAFWTLKPAGLYTGDNGAMISGRALLRTLIG